MLRKSKILLLLPPGEKKYREVIMANLMEEFDIHYVSEPLFTIGGHEIAVTNSSIFMFLAIIAATLFMTLSMSRRALTAGLKDAERPPWMR